MFAKVKTELSHYSTEALSVVKRDMIGHPPTTSISLLRD